MQSKLLFFTALCLVLLNSCRSTFVKGSSGLNLSNWQLTKVYENKFSKQQLIAFEEDLIKEVSTGEFERIKRPTEDAEWIAEGWGGAIVEAGKLWVAPSKFDENLQPIQVPEKDRSHMVLWNKHIFPKDFLLEFKVNHCTSDNGLTLLFFCATGNNGEDIFELNLPARRAHYRNYTKGAIANYSDSYWSRNKKPEGEALTNRVRKNPGFEKVSSGESRTSLSANKDYIIRIFKAQKSIKIEVDGVVVNEWEDENPLAGGRIGLRCMSGVKKVAYDDFKVWNISAKK